jgi:Zn-dependent protease with chaperone function
MPSILPSLRTPSRLVALALTGALLSSCLTTQLPPVSATGAAFEPTPDELALWQEARIEEESLREAVAIYDDPLLEAYLEDVAARLVPPGMAANRHLRYRVSVIEDPTLNAFAYPHGPLYVHTGLLARLENEDQLATVFGHEMSHVEYRHMLRYRRSLHNKQVALTAASVATAIILTGEEWDQWREGDWGEAAMVGVFRDVVLGLGLQLAFLASVNGYGRDLELEADRGGFQKLAAAGYEPSAAPRLYEILLEGSDGDAGKVQTYFFGSHPRLTERIASARDWAGTQGGAAAAEGDVVLAAAGDGGEVVEAGDGGGSQSAAGGAVAFAASGAARGTEPRPEAGGGEAAPAAALLPAGGGTAEAGNPPTARGDAREPLTAADELFRRRLAPVVRDDARLQLEAGRIDQAEEELARAMAWMPGDPKSHLLDARIRFARAVLAVDDAERRELRLEGRDALLEAIRLDADLALAHRDLGLFLYEEDDLAGACRELGFYLELDPDAPDAERIEDYLRELRSLGAC